MLLQSRGQVRLLVTFAATALVVAACDGSTADTTACVVDFTVNITTGSITIRANAGEPDGFYSGDAVISTDAVTGTQRPVPLAGPANRQGRIAADNSLGRESTYRGTQGTSIVQVFDLVVAMTGASEKVPVLQT